MIGWLTDWLIEFLWRSCPGQNAMHQVTIKLFIHCPCHCVGKGLGTNEVEWAGKAEISYISWQWTKHAKLYSDPFQALGREPFMVPAGSPSYIEDVVVYVCDIKPTELAHSFLFCSCAYLCLYSHFNCITFLKFFPPFSTFSLSSSSFISALLVLSTVYLFMKVSHSPAFFSKPHPSFFLCWLWLMPVPVWAGRIK